MIRCQALVGLALSLAAAATAAQPGAAVGTGRSAASITDARSDDAASNAARAAVLARAESELAQGDTAAALDSFERAAMMLHAPDTEMGLVRTYLQGGQYRRALAFCAHTAGSHLESAGAGALYAWLLQVGGHAPIAQQVLDETLARAPADPIAIGVQQAFAQANPLASGVLLDLPHRMAPQAALIDDAAQGVAATARVVGSGVLVDRGRRALVPNAGLAASGPSTLWVRNGLGQTVRGTLDPVSQPLRDLGVAIVLLSTPLDAGPARDSAPRAPFAGSAGAVVEYATSTHADAAWPQLRRGFLGAFTGQQGLRHLGIDVPSGPHGGPIFDALGRVVGMALPGLGQGPLMLPEASWRAVLSGADTAAAAPPPAPTGGSAAQAAQPVSPDETYEYALRLTLQVIVAP